MSVKHYYRRIIIKHNVIWHHKAAHCYYLLSHLSPPLFFSCFRNHPSVFRYPLLPFPFPLSCYQFSARNCWGWMRDETSGDSRLSRWRVSRVLTQGRRQQLMLDDVNLSAATTPPVSAAAAGHTVNIHWCHRSWRVTSTQWLTVNRDDHTAPDNNRPTLHNAGTTLT